MKSFISVICNILLSLTISAQTINKTISGLVKDIQNEPVAGATISLLKAADSVIIQTKASKENGKFEFSIPTNGTFILNITAVGNKKYYSNPFTIDDKRTGIQLPAIILLPQKKTDLKEVVVTAKKPLIEQEIDKTIVNVDAMISAATGNTLEVLEKTPGVTVSTDGEISLNGRAGVLVLIDGRSTYMSGQDLASYLKSLPGSMLDKIELMSNPPAKYDAAGNAVINIRLKKNKVHGYTGNIALNYSQGRAGRSYNNINLNYLKKKINLFVNAGYSRDGNIYDELYQRAFYTNNEKNMSVGLHNHYIYSSDEISGRIGMDYNLSSKTIIGFTTNINYRPKKDKGDYVSNSYSAGDILDSVGYGYSYGDYTWKQFGANLNFQQKFKKDGRELSADMNYISYNNDGEQFLQNMVDLSSGEPISSYGFFYKLPSTISIYTGKADYSHTLNNKMVLSAGVKSGVVTNDNNAGYFNVINNSNNPDYGKSNHFIYRENINAAYINGRKDWKRFGTQLGLRLENTQTNGHQLGNDSVAQSSFSRNYTGLFPTVYFSYKLDSMGNHTLTLNFARRLNRPNYQLLNPFLFYRDQYTYGSGNPYLGPTYGNKVLLGYRYKQWLGITMQYDRLSHNIIDATEAIGNIFITRPQNIYGGHMFALFVNLNLSPLKWWNFNLNAATAHFVNKGTVYTESIYLTQNAYRFNLLNQFKFKNDWNGEISGFYSSKDISWQRITEPRYRFNAAVQKKIMKGKGTLKLSVDDIFYSWKVKVNTIGIKNASSYQTTVWDSRRVGLSFNFNFGKDTFARKRKVGENAADDLKGRVE
ncbi:MAG: outer membrane beta-barrel protein [Flavobacterium sp.]